MAVFTTAARMRRRTTKSSMVQRRNTAQQHPTIPGKPALLAKEIHHEQCNLKI
jgi:hypothetical protein